MTYIVQRQDRFYVVAYDGLDPLTGKERRRWQPVGHDRTEAEAVAASIDRDHAGAAPARGGQAPDLDVTGAQLERAVRVAAAEVHLRVPEMPQALTWGDQVDVQPITTDGGLDGQLTAEEVAFYLSKYVVKSGADVFGLDGMVKDPDAARRLGANDHVVAMMATTVRLAASVDGLGRWTHMLGFRGHIQTKSRMFTTTLRAIHDDRVEYQRQRYCHLDGEDTTLLVGEWVFDGIGYLTEGDKQLAAAGGQWTREAYIDWRTTSIDEQIASLLRHLRPLRPTNVRQDTQGPRLHGVPAQHESRTRSCQPLPRAPASIWIREDYLTESAYDFFAERVFGPNRRDYLVAQLSTSTKNNHKQIEGRIDALRLAITDIEARKQRLIQTLERGDDPDGVLHREVRERLAQLAHDYEAKLADLTVAEATLATDRPSPELLDQLPPGPIDLPGAPRGSPTRNLRRMPARDPLRPRRQHRDAPRRRRHPHAARHQGGTGRPITADGARPGRTGARQQPPGPC
jgi:hypothetical protein